MALLTSLVLLSLALCIATVNSFHAIPGRELGRRCLSPKMEYIPDGLTKQQWEEIKRKEEEETKKKNLGAVGVTKFKSRSFEAWQKSGSNHLFPVSGSVPINARPYMQRNGGSADGTDLKKKGLTPQGQGKASARNEADDKYEQLQKDGRLGGLNLPWTAEATKNLAKDSPAEKGKNVKPNTQKDAEEPPKKKGFFGLF